MSSETLVYIFIAAIIALLAALFQYTYKTKKTPMRSVFITLRFLSVLLLLILLINPKIDKTIVFEVKPNLVIAIDNSASIDYLNENDKVTKVITKLSEHDTLNDMFDLQFYEFSKDLNKIESDTLKFKGRQTNISKALRQLNQIYDRDVIAPIMLITDGNQTFGYDYNKNDKSIQQPVYPIMLGDTATYVDLKIQQLNVNKYAFLKNKFPVEMFIGFNGRRDLTTSLKIYSNDKVVYSKPVNFSKNQTTKTITAYLSANNIGLNTYYAKLDILNNEKNITNNNKPFAIEVIDQRTNIVIVSDKSHPDLGMLKKAIERNEQRSVSILTPIEFLDNSKNFQLAIIYQPSSVYRDTFLHLERAGINTMVITGAQTEWAFLNQVQANYSVNPTSQFENYQALLNSNFRSFIIDEIDFESFPPLLSEFGETNLKSNSEVLLYKTVNGLTLDSPLLLVSESGLSREVVLFGENIWKWRVQSFLNTESFEQFDKFIGNIIQYLSTNNIRNRLQVDFESFYVGNDNIIIKAQYFNSNYEFDSKDNLTMTLSNLSTNEKLTIPFILKNDYYQIDLSALEPNTYNFQVNSNNNEFTELGSFEILPFDVEKQFLNTNVVKLKKIANQTNGANYFANNIDGFIQDLILDKRYKTVQKSMKNIVPLIDQKFILALIVLCLALEWFGRKYNGLI
jgi:hypothetical protein